MSAFKNFCSVFSCMLIIFKNITPIPITIIDLIEDKINIPIKVFIKLNRSLVWNRNCYHEAVTTCYGIWNMLWGLLLNNNEPFWCCLCVTICKIYCVRINILKIWTCIRGCEVVYQIWGNFLGKKKVINTQIPSRVLLPISENINFTAF